MLPNFSNGKSIFFVCKRKRLHASLASSFFSDFLVLTVLRVLTESVAHFNGFIRWMLGLIILASEVFEGKHGSFKKKESWLDCVATANLKTTGLEVAIVFLFV